MCKIHKLLEAGAKNNNGESELRYEKKLSGDRTYYNTDKIIRKDKVEFSKQNSSVLVFHLGLITHQPTIFYSGLTFMSVLRVTVYEQNSNTKTSRRVIYKGMQSQVDKVIAYGGRFDNHVAHHTLRINQEVPMALGLTLKLSQIADKIFQDMERVACEYGDPSSSKVEQNIKKVLNSYIPPLVDVVIYSSAEVQDLTAEDEIAISEQKLDIMHELNSKGIKVYIDYNYDCVDDFQDFYIENNVRYVVKLNYIKQPSQATEQL